MELQHINVKFFVEGELKLDPVRFIEVFHEWIREDTLAELMIDVADYRHVPAGPGVLLVGLDSDYSMDNARDRWGLRYNRKAPLDGSNEDRFGHSLRLAANACRLLEEHFASSGPLKFARQELELTINDRALAPNTPETFAACKPELEAFLTTTLGHGDLALEHHSDPRRLFGVTVKLDKPFDFAALAGTP